MLNIVSQMVGLIFKFINNKNILKKAKARNAKCVSILNEIFIRCGRSKRVMIYFIIEQKLNTPNLHTT